MMMYIDLSAARARRPARPEPVAGVRLPTPSYGRFLQTDPIGYGDGLNMYGYVGGDPVNLIDPSGLSAQGELDPRPEEHCIEGCSPTIVVTGSGRKPGSGQKGPTGWGRGSGGGGGGGGGWGITPKSGKKARMKSSTKRYLCRKLAANGFNVPKAYRDVLSDRKTPTNGKSNWGVPEFRQSENFLYATGQWRYPATGGSSYTGVYAHQYSKYFSSETTPFDQDALNAGLDGVDHKNDSPSDLKAFCNVK